MAGLYDAAIAAVANLFRKILTVWDRRDEEATRHHDQMAKHSTDELSVGTDELRKPPPAL